MAVLPENYEGPKKSKKKPENWKETSENVYNDEPHSAGGNHIEGTCIVSAIDGVTYLNYNCEYSILNHIVLLKILSRSLISDNLTNLPTMLRPKTDIVVSSLLSVHTDGYLYGKTGIHVGSMVPVILTYSVN
jgi:hypothetical protein